MMRSREPKHPKLSVQFTNDYTCHQVSCSKSQIKVEERWKRDMWLGKGSYGEVWRQQCMTDEAPRRLRAVKEIVKVSSSSGSIDYTRELEAIAKFSADEYARYFVKSSGWYENEYFIFIVMEYMQLGDLQGHLGRAFPEAEAQTIIFQLFEALKCMHDHGYAHRDLKPANIFVVSTGPNWWVKVGDFGVSKQAEQELTALRTVIGTPNYLAPEILENEGSAQIDILDFSYTSAVDIWSVGVILFYMLTNRFPFVGIRALLKYTASPDDGPFLVLRSHGVTEVGQDFAKSLLCVRPIDRLSAKGALQHRWRTVIPGKGEAPSNENNQPTPALSTEPSEHWSALDRAVTPSNTPSASPSTLRHIEQVPLPTAESRSPDPRKLAEIGNENHGPEAVEEWRREIFYKTGVLPRVLPPLEIKELIASLERLLEAVGYEDLDFPPIFGESVAPSESRHQMRGMAGTP